MRPSFFFCPCHTLILCVFVLVELYHFYSFVIFYCNLCHIRARAYTHAHAVSSNAFLLSNSLRHSFLYNSSRYLRTKRKFIIRRRQRGGYRCRGFSVSCIFAGKMRDGALAPSTLARHPARGGGGGGRLPGDGVDFAKALVLSISRIEDGRRGERRAE